MGVTPDDLVSDHDRAVLVAAAAEQAAKLAAIGDGLPVEASDDSAIKTADVEDIIAQADSGAWKPPALKSDNASAQA